MPKEPPPLPATSPKRSPRGAGTPPRRQDSFRQDYTGPHTYVPAVGSTVSQSDGLRHTGSCVSGFSRHTAPSALGDFAGQESETAALVLNSSSHHLETPAWRHSPSDEEHTAATKIQCTWRGHHQRTDPPKGDKKMHLGPRHRGKHGHVSRARRELGGRDSPGGGKDGPLRGSVETSSPSNNGDRGCFARRGLNRLEKWTGMDIDRNGVIGGPAPQSQPKMTTVEEPAARGIDRSEETVESLCALCESDEGIRENTQGIPCQTALHWLCDHDDLHTGHIRRAARASPDSFLQPDGKGQTALHVLCLRFLDRKTPAQNRQLLAKTFGFSSTVSMAANVAGFMTKISRSPTPTSRSPTSESRVKFADAPSESKDDSVSSGATSGSKLSSLLQRGGVMRGSADAAEMLAEHEAVEFSDKYSLLEALAEVRRLPIPLSIAAL